MSPIELGYYGVEPESAQSLFEEALAVILKGLDTETLNFQGRHFQFRDVPIELHPVQRPHPPLWYGVARPDSTAWTARHGMNIVCNGRRRGCARSPTGAAPNGRRSAIRRRPCR